MKTENFTLIFSMIKGNHSLQLGHPQDSSLEKLNAEFSVTWNKNRNP